ncbi:hypothetical protein OZX68_03400 [Streptococcaceae bacterium ESL0729]|nr:hypothetical protein OZX68_03400 [Streptococcaceae bacterium ESL0729]
MNYNYAALSKELGRSYDTIRKWRSDITRISGYEFKRTKVINGRGRKNRTIYYFTEDDLDCFKDMAEMIDSGKTKEQAISEIFGNIEESKKAKSERFLDDSLRKLFHNGKNLQTELASLTKQVSVQSKKINELQNRLEVLENKKGFSRIFK